MQINQHAYGSDLHGKPTSVTLKHATGQLLHGKITKYFGVNIIASSGFACSLDNARRNFCRAFNAVYGKVGGIASEEVLLHLFQSKCMPLLLYGSEVCPLKKSQLRSVDYVITNCFMKVFKTRSKDIVLECMAYFHFPAFEILVETRRCKFLRKYNKYYKSNLVCCIFQVDSALLYSIV